MAKLDAGETRRPRSGAGLEGDRASSGTSFVHETEGQLILNGSYDIAFTMDLALKDLGFAMKFGDEFGVPLDLATPDPRYLRQGQGSLWRRRAIDPDRQAARGCRRHGSESRWISRSSRLMEETWVKEVVQPGFGPVNRQTLQRRFGRGRDVPASGFRTRCPCVKGHILGPANRAAE